MAKKKYDLAVKTGSYEKNGETKNRYQNIGSVFEGDHGFYMVLDRTFNPAGVPNPEDRSSLIVSMFEPRDNNQPAATPQPGPKAPANFDDEIPF